TIGTEPGDEAKLLQSLQRHPAVLHAQYNQRVQPRKTFPNDERYFEQWHMDIINAPDIWDFTTGGLTPNGDTIVIAMLDGGFDAFHEDLIDNIWRNHGEIPNDGIDNDNNGYVDDIDGWNVKDNSNDHTARVPINSISHGTATAGIAGARGDNRIGLAGVNWNVKLMLLSGTEFEDEIVEAYLYAYEQRKLYNETNCQQGAYVVVTNFSLGIDDAFAADSPIWCGVYNILGEEGILSIGATTNRNVNVDIVGDMPTTCASEFLLSVTSTDQADAKADRAGVGERSIDLGAPGQ
ncbi:MAG: S8 family serine peptidase, partial [Bacteroidota bacterium]